VVKGRRERGEKKRGKIRPSSLFTVYSFFTNSTSLVRKQKGERGKGKRGGEEGKRNVLPHLPQIWRLTVHQIGGRKGEEEKGRRSSLLVINLGLFT